MKGLRVTFWWLCVPPPHLHFDLAVSVAQVLQVGSGVGLHRWEVMLQHMDHLRKFRVAPRKFPEKRESRKLQHVHSHVQ